MRSGGPRLCGSSLCWRDFTGVGMSNVLIGIIGVILFIGLALAGALFLGPRFQESTNNSKAAAVIQSVGQVAAATNLYEVSEGQSYTSSTNEMSGVDDLLARGYLKARPTNPVTYFGVVVLSPGGSFGDARSGWAVMPLNDDGDAVPSSEAVRVCRSIARQNGQSVPADGTAPTASSPLSTGRQVGCVRVSAQWGDIGADRIIAFARI